jgi:hypothetical protein
MCTTSTRSLLEIVVRNVALAALLCPANLVAQLPRLPVLQNAFGNPGLTIAANVGGGDGDVTYAAAASFGAGRIMLSGGVGAVVPDSGDSSPAYGVRAAMPVASFMGGKVGIAAFAGIGGTSHSGVSSVEAPVGAGIGWRTGIGATRGISVYVAPMMSYYRASAEGESVNTWLFRPSIGVDFALTRRLGITIGAQGGANANEEEGDPGPTGSLVGIGVAWALKGG